METFEGVIRQFIVISSFLRLYRNQFLRSYIIMPCLCTERQWKARKLMPSEEATEKGII